MRLASSGVSLSARSSSNVRGGDPRRYSYALRVPALRVRRARKPPRCNSYSHFDAVDVWMPRVWATSLAIRHRPFLRSERIRRPWSLLSARAACANGFSSMLVPFVSGDLTVSSRVVVDELWSRVRGYVNASGNCPLSDGVPDRVPLERSCHD